jgi:pimeloyl-ACP methyl ester carboxylesterase
MKRDVVKSVISCLALVVGCSQPAPPPPAPEPPAWTDAASHTSGFITTNGVRLHHLDWGGSGPALILIHGYGDNPHAFDDLAPSFTDRFRVVADARRGHGRSDSKGPYDTATLVEDLRGVMDSLRIAKASLAGWSMGGNEITGMAGTHPDRVDRIVYLDAGYDWADPTVVAAFGQTPADFTPPPAAMVSIDAYRSSHIRAWFTKVSDPSRIEAYIRDLVTIQPDGSVRSTMTDSAGAALFASLTTQHRDYRKVKAPALAIYSATFFDTSHPDSAQAIKNTAWESQFLIPFRKASIARITTELPGVEIVGVPGTHADFLFVSKDEVVTAIRRFLGVSPAGG